ncbi:hypothetical protein BTVI_73345 [Pitangus sulphuratus]|nr:hypothetical protein BTVI_73345 [Pitangus sulphuratus]
MIRAMKQLFYGERLRQFRLFSLEKRSLWGDLIVAFQYLKGTYKKDEEIIFTRAAYSNAAVQTDSNGNNCSSLLTTILLAAPPPIPRTYLGDTRVV